MVIHNKCGTLGEVVERFPDNSVMVKTPSGRLEILNNDDIELGDSLLYHVLCVQGLEMLDRFTLLDEAWCEIASNCEASLEGLIHNGKKLSENVLMKLASGEYTAIKTNKTYYYISDGEINRIDNPKAAIVEALSRVDNLFTSVSEAKEFLMMRGVI